MGHGVSDGQRGGRGGGPSLAGLAARDPADQQQWRAVPGRAAGRPPPGRPAGGQQLAVRGGLLAAQPHRQLLHPQPHRTAAEERYVAVGGDGGGLFVGC